VLNSVVNDALDAAIGAGSRGAERGRSVYLTAEQIQSMTQQLAINPSHARAASALRLGAQ
jgi:hypothetical protein